MNEKLTKQFLKYQEYEKLHAIIYKELGEISKDTKNGELLLQLSEIEERHFIFLKNITQQETKIDNRKIRFTILAAKLLGVTFVIKYLEKKESELRERIKNSSLESKELIEYMQTEFDYEDTLQSQLEDEKLFYISAIILGLDDALVEISGSLAGYTFVIDNPKIIAMVGFITGVAATLSMAAAEYLSVKSDESSKLNYKKAALYTGIVYILTVSCLIFPYALNLNKFVSLILMMMIGLFIVFIFNFYVAITTKTKILTRFFRMSAIIVTVAIISFSIGYLVQQIFDIRI